MAVVTRIEPIAKDISVFIDDIRKAGTGAFAEFARQAIEEAKEQNRSILGSVPSYDVFVDGSKGAALESVKPTGVIVAVFQLIDDVLRFIGEELVRHSPHLSGRYEHSHVLLADGSQIDPAIAQTTLASEYVFINTQPYARKIERGFSPQAPNGVYEVVAAMARRKFARIGKIEFNYRTLGGGQRNPAIVVKPK